MKKIGKVPHRFSSITDLHRRLDLPTPRHPLVSLFDNTQIVVDKKRLPTTFLFDFYNISYKKRTKGRTGYGQSYYDFDDGTLTFTALGQVITTVRETDYYGLSLLIHPDFLRTYPLGKTIKQFGFFAYAIHEALHLSEKEKAIVLTIFNHIDDELNNAIDDYSQDIIVTHVETLLNYSNRFYKRQFITRKPVNHDLLTQLDALLTTYFDQNQPLLHGLPSVDYLAEQLHLSPRYLSDMLRSLTGQNTQQLIHEKLLDKAKEYLAGTSLSVTEIAYRLGFEHPQSFNKLFKQKLKLTPIAYKQSFN